MKSLIGTTQELFPAVIIRPKSLFEISQEISERTAADFQVTTVAGRKFDKSFLENPGSYVHSYYLLRDRSQRLVGFYRPEGSMAYEDCPIGSINFSDEYLKDLANTKIREFVSEGWSSFVIVKRLSDRPPDMKNAKFAVLDSSPETTTRHKLIVVHADFNHKLVLPDFQALERTFQETLIGLSTYTTLSYGVVAGEGYYKLIYSGQSEEQAFQAAKKIGPYRSSLIFQKGGDEVKDLLSTCLYKP